MMIGPHEKTAKDDKCFVTIQMNQYQDERSIDNLVGPPVGKHSPAPPPARHAPCSSDGLMAQQAVHCGKRCDVM